MIKLLGILSEGITEVKGNVFENFIGVKLFLYATDWWLNILQNKVCLHCFVFASWECFWKVLENRGLSWLWLDLNLMMTLEELLYASQPNELTKFLFCSLNVSGKKVPILQYTLGLRVIFLRRKTVILFLNINCLQMWHFAFAVLSMCAFQNKVITSLFLLCFVRYTFSW